MAQQSYTKEVMEKALEIASHNNGEAVAGMVSAVMLAKTKKEHKRVLIHLESQ